MEQCEKKGKSEFEFINCVRRASLLMLGWVVSQWMPTKSGRKKKRRLPSRSRHTIEIPSDFGVFLWGRQGMEQTLHTRVSSLRAHSPLAWPTNRAERKNWVEFLLYGLLPFLYFLTESNPESFTWCGFQRRHYLSLTQLRGPLKTLWLKETLDCLIYTPNTN